MTLNKKHEKRYYTDLNDITAYKWDLLTKSGDYIHICREGKKPDKLALGAYQHLLFQFEELDLSNLRERRDISIQAIELIQTLEVDGLEVEEVKALSLLLRALVINPIEAPLDLLKKLIKSPEQKVQLSFIEVAIKQYNQTRGTAAKQKDIFQRAAACSKALNGTPIDVKKISIVQFHAYEKAAYNI
jgi:hypothetical protein